MNIDIITHGSPCQDFSVAGKGAGGEEGQGTRSSLMHTTVDIVAEVKPTYVVWENVKNVLSAKHRGAFDAYCAELERLGYNNYWKVLNSKHYGIPQNRERIFCISIRRDVDPYFGLFGHFPWPEPFDNGIRLKHLLETQVDEKYYLSEEKTAKLVMQLKGNETIGVNHCITPDRVDKRQNGRRFKNDDDEAFTLTGQDRHGVGIAVIQSHGEIKEQKSGIANCVDANYHKGFDNHGQRTGVASAEPNECLQVAQLPGYEKNGRIYSEDGASPCLSARDYKDPIKVAVSNECHLLGRIDVEGHDILKRVYAAGGIAPTLSTMQGGSQEPKTMQDFRMRKLVPIECWRLQSFTDADFHKAKDAGISDSQLYKQAGNSITVDVLYHIFKGMFTTGTKLTLLDLFAGIGAFHKGLERAGVEVDLYAYCEIDKYASRSYSAIHGVSEDKNLWDVTKILPEGLLAQKEAIA